VLTFIGLFTFICSCDRTVFTDTDRMLEELDRVLQHRPDYMTRKEQRIVSLRMQFSGQPLSPENRYWWVR